jgi:AcrR family transcriptional regulator
MRSETTVTEAGAESGERKDDLLARAAEYVLDHGLADLSLRPLAHALRTSPRMLMYYFGSKDGLIVDVLDHVRNRTRLELDLAGEGALRRYWRWATSRDGQAYLRMVYEVYGLSLREPERYREFLRNETLDVIDGIAGDLQVAGAAQREARELATEIFALLRGLELDLLGTGDRARVNAVFEAFAARMEQRGQEMARSTRRNKR